jgi:hypothetical protein
MKNTQKCPGLINCQAYSTRRRYIEGPISTILKAISLAVAFIFSIHQAAQANGGTFATSAVYSTGNLLPERKQKIELMDELLEVSFDGGLDSDWATVKVTYTLQNHGGPDSMTYGFPVDVTLAGPLSTIDQSIEDFSIMDGDSQLDISREIKMPRESGDYTEEPYARPVRDWFFTTLKFDWRETKTLVVSYRVKCGGTQSGTSKSIFWGQSPRAFVYTFKPADTWGNGRLHHLEIKVDTTNLISDHIPINSVQPPGSSDENGKLHWTFTDVQLSNAPDLVINYNSAARQLSAQVNNSRLDPKWIASIHASSTHAPSSKANYDVRNLLDNRLDTAWIPATNGPGDGERIDVTFKKPIDLNAIGFVNGYLKSSQLLAENGQVSKAHIHVYAVKGDDWTEDIDVKATAFPESGADPAESVQWVFDSGDSNFLTRHFRLTIKKALPGTRYSDTAISELYILGSPHQSDGQ